MPGNRLASCLFLGAALALAPGAPAADQPDPKLFAEAFVPKFKESCVGSAKQESAGKIPDGKIDAYCGCVAKRMSDFGDADKVELMQTAAPPSPGLQQKLNEAVAQCGSETLR
jgi:hypothetical protein